MWELFNRYCLEFIILDIDIYNFQIFQSLNSDLSLKIAPFGWAGLSHFMNLSSYPNIRTWSHHLFRLLVRKDFQWQWVFAKQNASFIWLKLNQVDIHWFHNWRTLISTVTEIWRNRIVECLIGMAVLLIVTFCWTTTRTQI